MKWKVGIVGAAGYTGGELVRLLLNHDAVEISFVQSRSQAGKPIHAVHTDLRGVSELKFTDDASVYSTPGLHAIFLALPHGEAKGFLSANKIADAVAIIDLSNDFRLSADASVAGRKFVYGLPELRREEIKKARNIANPGCFATALELALLPLAKAGKLPAEGSAAQVVVTGITGSTGAGQKLAETSHFSFRSGNIQAYKTLTHQHLDEVMESLRALQPKAASVSFIPWRGNFTRGIFASACLNVDLSRDQVMKLYRDYYQGHPFVFVSDSPIDMKSVVNTNRAQIEIAQEGKQLVIHIVIDNLLKGASGQALQNFNLLMGLPETQGLQLKGAAF